MAADASYPAPALRRAVPEDAATLARLHVEGWRAAYAGLMPDAVLAALSVERREKDWRGWLGAPSSRLRVWIAEVDGEAVGFASAGPSRDPGADPQRVAELHAMYLLREAWGRGIGRALFAHAVADLRERGYEAMTLWVLDANARARRFYEVAGMRADGASKVEAELCASLPHVRYALALRSP